MSVAIAPRERCKPGATHGDSRDHGLNRRVMLRDRDAAGTDRLVGRAAPSPLGVVRLLPRCLAPWAKQPCYPKPQSPAETPKLEPWIARCFAASPGLRRAS